MRRGVLLTLFTVTVLLSGCMMGPNYQRPEVDTPQRWRFEDKEAKDVANTAWWEQFGYPVLNELIQTALKENKDVKIAAARVEEYVGRYGFTHPGYCLKKEKFKKSTFSSFSGKLSGQGLPRPV